MYRLGKGERPQLNSVSLSLEMAKVRGRSPAAVPVTIPPSINSDAPRELDQSVSSTGTRYLSRRASRLLNRGPQIVVDPPPPEESLYPSLTTLVSLESEEEDDFSCKDCCRAGVCVCVCVCTRQELL